MKRRKYLFFILIVMMTWAFIMTSSVQAQEWVNTVEALWPLWEPTYVSPDPVTGLPIALSSFVIRTASEFIPPPLVYSPAYGFPLGLIPPSVYNNPLRIVYFDPIFGISTFLLP